MTIPEFPISTEKRIVDSLFPLDETTTMEALNQIAENSDKALEQAEATWMRQNALLHNVVFGLIPPQKPDEYIPYRYGALFTYSLVENVSRMQGSPLPTLDTGEAHAFINPYMKGLSRNGKPLDIDPLYAHIGQMDESFGKAIGIIRTFIPSGPRFRQGVVATYVPIAIGAGKKIF